MKKWLLIGLMAALYNPSRAQFSKASLQATGLTCAMCSNAVNKALQNVPFVGSVKSDIKNSSFLVSFKEGEDVDIDALRVAVEDAGFAIGKLQITGKFSEMKIEKDQHVKIGNDNFHFLEVSDPLLNGEKTITVVEKAFMTEKQFKKYNNATKMDCFKTGKSAACCVKEGIGANERIYHVTI